MMLHSSAKIRDKLLHTSSELMYIAPAPTARAVCKSPRITWIGCRVPIKIADSLARLTIIGTNGSGEIPFSQRLTEAAIRSACEDKKHNGIQRYIQTA